MVALLRFLLGLSTLVWAQWRLVVFVGQIWTRRPSATLLRLLGLAAMVVFRIPMWRRSRAASTLALVQASPAHPCPLQAVLVAAALVVVG